MLVRQMTTEKVELFIISGKIYFYIWHILPFKSNTTERQVSKLWMKVCRANTADIMVTWGQYSYKNTDLAIDYDNIGSLYHLGNQITF